MSMNNIFALLNRQKKTQPSAKVEYIVAGLGNPGREYAGTRHNAGFMFIDKLSEKYGFEVKKIKFKSLIADTVIKDKRCIVMKPSTFMNNSGEAVRECADFYKIPPEHIIIIFDDISLEPGKIRIRKKGSAGGHNGIKSILYQLNSDAFPRIKIGVGKKPSPEYDMIKWVLGTFTAEDRQAVDSAEKRAVDALELMLCGNIDEAMNKHNA